MGFKVITIEEGVFFHFEGFLHFQSPRMLSDTGILWIFWGVAVCSSQHTFISQRRQQWH